MLYWLRKLFGPKPVIPMTHEVLISENVGKFQRLYQYASFDDAMADATRFARIAEETGNGNAYMVSQIQG